MQELVQFFSSNIIELAGYVADANKRIFALYLVSALILALPVYWLLGRQSANTISKEATDQAPLNINQNFFGFVLAKRVWLAPSARLDYLMFVVNKLVKAAVVAPLLITIVPIAIGLSNGLESVFGKIEPVTQNTSIIIAVFTFLLFVADDFSRFLLHWLLHKVPFLWAFHKVHHSAKVLTPFTIYRSHPVENLLYAFRMTLSQGMVVGVCYYWFGPTLTMFDLLGANLFVFLFNLAGSNLRHSHIWLTWGDRVEGWLISPAQHQIHHSSDIEHFDSNLGSALAIWDRMAGSLIKASSVKADIAATSGSTLPLGVHGEPNLHSNLWQIYTVPFTQAFRALIPSKKSNLKQSRYTHSSNNTAGQLTKK